MAPRMVQRERATLRGTAAPVLIKDKKSQDALPDIIIDDSRFTGLGSTQKSTQTSEVIASKLYSVPVWKPDLDLLAGWAFRAISCPDEDPRGMIQFCTVANKLVRQMCQAAVPNRMSLVNLDLPPHLLKYLDWMKRRCEYKETGILTPPDSPSRSDTEEASLRIPEIESFIEKYPVDGPNYASCVS